MFGVSFPELMLIGAVALIIVGPQRLPGMLGTLGKWSNKLRRMLFDVRQQSGIDDILRAEGISGGLKEIRDLRNAVRGNVTGLLTTGTAPPRQGVQQLLNQQKATAPATAVTAPVEAVTDPYADVSYDRTREYPDEGPDAYGSIPDDLWAASRSTGSVSQAPASQAPVSRAPAQQAPLAATTDPVTTAAAAVAVISAVEAVNTSDTTSTVADGPGTAGEEEPSDTSTPSDTSAPGAEPEPEAALASESTDQVTTDADPSES